MPAGPKETGLYRLFDLIVESGKSFCIVSSEVSASKAKNLIGSDYGVVGPNGQINWEGVDFQRIAGHKCLLIPDATPYAREEMRSVAARLAKLGCKLRVTDTGTCPNNWTVADWNGSAEEFIAWAHAHTSDYTVPAPDPSPTKPTEANTEPTKSPSVGFVGSPSTPIKKCEAPVAQDAGPATIPHDDTPPLEAYAADPPAHEPVSEPVAHKTRRKRPNLAVVDGNKALAPNPDSEKLPQALSEDHLAEVFAEQHSEDWRYVKRWDKWFKWDGDGWVEDEKAEVFTLARELCREATYWPEAAVLTPTSKRQLCQRRIASNVRDMASADRLIAASTDQWDLDHWLLGVPGGVVDLCTGKLLEAERSHYIRLRTSVAPKRGPHPLWNKVLSRATRSDPTVTHYLAKWAGYMLTGDTREEAFLFVHGPGGSGKSTFVQVIRDCMGKYARAARIETFMQSRHGEHPTEIADLAGARLVSAPETEEGARWNESRIKMLTGRDKVKARFMARDYFEFDPVCKIMIFGNHRPRLYSVGEEMKRRLHLVEFPDSIPEQERDGSLKVAIREEYPAILQWMIDGCLAWQSEGLGRPEAVSQATDDYLSSQDTLGDWIEEALERGDFAKCKVSDAYRHFSHWAEERGEIVPSVTTFSEKMQARGFPTRKISVKYFLGVALKATDEPPSRRYPD